MPYRRVGKVVQHKKGGKWSKKQTATSVENAEKAIRLLRGVEHGMVPRKRTRSCHTKKVGFTEASRGIGDLSAGKLPASPGRGVNA